MAKWATLGNSWCARWRNLRRETVSQHSSSCIWGSIDQHVLITQMNLSGRIHVRARVWGWERERERERERESACVHHKYVYMKISDNISAPRRTALTDKPARRSVRRQPSLLPRRRWPQQPQHRQQRRQLRGHRGGHAAQGPHSVRPRKCGLHLGWRRSMILHSWTRLFLHCC